MMAQYGSNTFENAMLTFRWTYNKSIERVSHDLDYNFFLVLPVLVLLTMILPSILNDFLLYLDNMLIY